MKYISYSRAVRTSRDHFSVKHREPLHDHAVLSSNCTMSAPLPAIDVIPPELHDNACQEQHAERHNGIAMLFTTEAVEHAQNVPMSAHNCAQPSDEVMQTQHKGYHVSLRERTWLPSLKQTL